MDAAEVPRCLVFLDVPDTGEDVLRLTRDASQRRPRERRGRRRLGMPVGAGVHRVSGAPDEQRHGIAQGGAVGQPVLDGLEASGR